MKETLLYIKELCCDEEARLVRAEIEGMKGIEGYEINLMTQSLRVTHDPEVISVQRLQDAIGKTGMKARLTKEGEVTGPVQWWKEPRIITLSLCGLLILLTLILEHILGLLTEEKAKFLYGAALFAGGYYHARMGLTALRTLTPNIRTLMVVGALGAVGLGLWEEAALLVLIYSFGDVLEAYAADRVRGAVRALMDLAPKEALVRRDGVEVTLPLDDVRMGDTFIVRPGERVPLDGEVLSGSSYEIGRAHV